MEYDKNTIQKVAEFFEKRFPEKNLSFEMKCGYFWEWCQRYESKSHLHMSDSSSLEIWKDIEK